jgi:hypothetical protein
MNSCRRIAAIVLLLLSQATAGMTVICDEGLGRHVMEFFPRVCCDVADDGGSASPAAGSGQDDCGPCRDLTLAPTLQREEERRDSPACQRLAVAAFPDALQPPPPGASACDGASPAARTPTVSRLARTVVLRC